MTYLVDSNVLSEATKLAPDRRVIEWLTQHEGDFVVDPIVLGELCFGIKMLPAGKKRLRLEAWFEAVVARVECIPWDAAASECWAELLVNLRKKGQSLPVLDSMIAATALADNLTLVTRNVSDFRSAGLKVLNPFE
ncbi:MAG: type II toxin-antitoxin system VapC family toxin [Verrucomicrobiia bacterium]